MDVVVDVALLLLSNGEYLLSPPDLLWPHPLMERKGYIINDEWKWSPAFSCDFHWLFLAVV